MVDHAEMRAAYIRALEFSPQENNQCECRYNDDKEQCIFCQDKELQLAQS